MRRFVNSQHDTAQLHMVPRYRHTPISRNASCCTIAAAMTTQMKKEEKAFEKVSHQYSIFKKWRFARFLAPQNLPTTSTIA
jgi:hypothetical protein